MRVGVKWYSDLKAQNRQRHALEYLEPRFQAQKIIHAQNYDFFSRTWYIILQSVTTEAPHNSWYNRTFVTLLYPHPSSDLALFPQLCLSQLSPIVKFLAVWSQFPPLAPSFVAPHASTNGLPDLPNLSSRPLLPHGSYSTIVPLATHSEIYIAGGKIRCGCVGHVDISIVWIKSAVVEGRHCVRLTGRGGLESVGFREVGKVWLRGWCPWVRKASEGLSAEFR